MKMQSAMSKNIAESVYRSVVAGITKTNTGASLTLGEPVILATGTIGAGPLGQEVIRALTVTNVTLNRLLLGPVASDTIGHEDVGLVQVYGVGYVRCAEAATVAAGDRLVPDLNSTATALAGYGRGAWIARTLTDTDIHYSSGAAVIAVAPATAVSGTNSYTNVQAFIRAM